MNNKPKQLRGFALMSKAKQLKIASMGGKALLKKRGKKHMSRIGSIGGAMGGAAKWINFRQNSKRPTTTIA